jgi:hypothetical protein
MTNKLLALLVLSLGVVGAAMAAAPVTAVPPNAVSAPEIDPATAFIGLTLLLGGLAVVRGRRSKKS